MSDTDLITVYVAIGNTDDKLGQARWAAFFNCVFAQCYGSAAHVYGIWASLPDEEYQNACFAIGLRPADAPELKRMLSKLAGEFDQDSISWAEARTTFLHPEDPS